MAVDEAISFWSEIQRFEDMLVADPRSLSFAPLSELYRKLGLLDDAIAVARKGCDLHPEYAGGFFALGSACLDKGLKDEARHALEHVIHLNPENLRAQKMLGQLYVEAGELGLARPALERVLEQNSEDTESELLLASISSTAGEPGRDEEILEDLEVIEDLTELVEEPEEEEPELSGFAGEEESAAGQGGAALSGEAQRQAARDPLTTATLAELYVSQGFLEKAIGIYLDLLGSDPGNPPYRLRLAELKSALDRQEEEGGGQAAPPLEAAEQEEEPEAQSPAGGLEVHRPPVNEAAVPAPQPVVEPPRPAAAAAPEPPTPAGSAAPEPTRPEAAAAAPHSEPAPAGEGGDVEAELSRWLENIRRRRDGL